MGGTCDSGRSRLLRKVSNRPLCPHGLTVRCSHADETTQWTHPKTGRRKRLTGELPFGWERTVEPDGTILFIEYADRSPICTDLPVLTRSHMSKKTTFTDPRLAFAVEEKEDGTDVHQQFDSSSTALQVTMSLSHVCLCIGIRCCMVKICGTKWPS